jgi:cell division protein FtsL
MFVFLKKYNSSKKEINLIVLCIAAFLSLTVYEIFIQQHIYKATFDIHDIIASALAAILANFICFWIDKKHYNEKLIF